jgi:hypothetical protein
MKSLMKDTPRPSLIKRNIPPLYKDLLIWTNRHYDADTHQIKSRLTPAYDLTLKQGLVFSSAGTGCLNYGVRNLITTSTTKMRWQFKLNTVAGAGGTRHICSQYNASGSKRGWSWYISPSNNLFIIIGNNGGTSASINTDNFLDGLGNKYPPQTGDFVDIVWNSGIVTITVNGTDTYTADFSATQTVIYNNNSPDLNIGGYLSATTASYNGSLCCFKIWVDNILDTDTPKFVAPMGDKQGIDTISGTIPAVVGTVDMTARADDASYDCEDNGFAVKDGDIYPKNYAGTGYAGLIGEPDATYHRLIALKGQIEIAGQAYLGTLFDFEHAPNTEIEGAGISWDEWDGEDANEDTVGTAETELDTDYYNAITASLMTNTSIAGYAGTSNVKSRLFFKVADRVMKDDGSFLAESGTVQEILVYKRDLTAGEILRVQKYCREVV